MSGISLRKTLLGTAKREGRIEGRIEGKVEGKVEGKIELLFEELGLSTKEIANKLSVDESYVNKVLKENSLI